MKIWPLVFKLYQFHYPKYENSCLYERTLLCYFIDVKSSKTGFPLNFKNEIPDFPWFLSIILLQHALNVHFYFFNKNKQVAQLRWHALFSLTINKNSRVFPDQINSPTFRYFAGQWNPVKWRWDDEDKISTTTLCPYTSI